MDAMNEVPKGAETSKPTDLPLVRTGQGDYTNDYTPSVNPNVTELLDATEAFTAVSARLKRAVEAMRLELGMAKAKH
jgi:hypothetical protein